MTDRPVQYFSDTYLKQCRSMTLLHIVVFLDEFRQLNHPRRKVPSKAISIRVPEDLLAAFRRRCDAQDVPYQSQIKKLMSDWLSS